MTFALNFFIKPLSPQMQVRTLTAHVSRGFCWHVMSPPGHVRSSLQLRMTLGLMAHLPTYKLASETTELKAGLANQILTLAARHWQGTLADFNTHWVDLEFKQLMSVSQVHALRMATQFLNHALHMTSIHERAIVMKTSDSIPKDVLDRLETSLASLDAALLAKDPMMPQHLRNTHSILVSYPETVHLLDDAEIAKIIDAAEVHTKTEIVKAAAKGASTGGTRKKVSVSDL